MNYFQGDKPHETIEDANAKKCPGSRYPAPELRYH